MTTANVEAKPIVTVSRVPRRSRLLWKEALYGYLFILPWVLGFLFFTAFPMLYGVYISFTRYEIFTPPQWNGVTNYVRILGGDDPLVIKSVANTLWFVMYSVPASMVAGLGLALLLNQNVRGMPLFRTLFYMPSVVPIVASVAVLMWVFHGRFGLVNILLREVGIVGPGWLTEPDWVKRTLVLWTVWNVGGGMIINLAGLQSIPQHLYEAAEIDGAGTVRKFWHVTLPMLSSTLFFNMVMGIISSFQVFTLALLLGGTSPWTPAGGPLNTLLFYVLYIWQNAFIFYKMGYAAAMAWILFLVVLVLTAIQFRLAGRWVYYETDAR